MVELMEALLVLDMVKDYVYGERPLVAVDERERLIGNIKQVIEAAHKKGIPVIYVNSAFTENDPIFKFIGHSAHRRQSINGTDGALTIEELAPEKSDHILEKHGYSGFCGSGLDGLLKELKITDIYLVGEQTDCCVRETGVDAVHRGYNVFMIKDCCSTSRPLGQESSIIFVERCVGRIVDASDFVALEKNAHSREKSKA